MTLQRPTESAQAALRRLEQRPDYSRIVASDEGQRLLERAADEARRARRDVGAGR